MAKRKKSKSEVSRAFRDAIQALDDAYKQLSYVTELSNYVDFSLELRAPLKKKSGLDILDERSSNRLCIYINQVADHAQSIISSAQEMLQASAGEAKLFDLGFTKARKAGVV